MDNSINSAVSFQAKLVTNIKGRNNIMKPVAKEFEKLTKKIPGELNIERYIDPYLDYPKHYAEFEYNGTSFITDKLFKLISKEDANPKEIASKLVGQLKAMMVESSFMKKITPIENSISEQLLNIRRAEHKLARAEHFGLDEVAAIVRKTIDGYRTEIAKSETTLSKMAKDAAKKMEKYENKGLDVVSQKEGLLWAYRD